MSSIKSYSELSMLRTFEDRYNYLQLRGSVGRPTFGYERYLNQSFYRSREWAQVRNEVIARDEARDLGVQGFEIHGRILIHHMNPMTSENIIHGEDHILDPEFLICVTHRTHNAIHFGDADQLLTLPKERSRGDTDLWTRRGSRERHTIFRS